MTILKTMTLEALKQSDAGRKLRDGGSMFGTVRASKAGEVSVDFQWRYKIGGKVRQVRIGSWPKMTLKGLRDARDDLASEVRKGLDPIERKTSERLKQKADQAQAIQSQNDRLALIAEQQARMTVRGLFSIWQAQALKQRKDGGKEALRAFELDVFPLIGDMAAADVKKANIQTIVDRMMVRGIVRMTKRVLTDMRQMFSFALDRDLIEVDPTARIKKASIGKDTERDRVLNERELSDLFDKLPASGLIQTTQAALLIQLATLTRIGEVMAARWDDVDFQRRNWTLPTTKNGKPHTIFLSDYAVSQLEALKDETGATPWLFPNRAGNGPLGASEPSKQTTARQMGGTPHENRTKKTQALKLQGGHWRPHDLRRTGATFMAELGVLPEVIERCLNHNEPNKIKRTYQRAAYEPQMRQAWQLWGQRLELLTNKPDNVVTLKAA